MHSQLSNEQGYESTLALGARPLVTNGFEVILPNQVEAIVRDLADPSEVKGERERLHGYWFVHRIDGRLFHIRLKGGGPNVDGEPIFVKTSEHPWLLRARLDDAIEEALPKYAAVRKRPFTFLAQKSELIADAAVAAAISHQLLPGFRVTPKFALSPKIYEPIDGQTKIGIFVTITMRYDIEADISELQAAGIDMHGMYVVRRIHQPGERRLLGRISSIQDGLVSLFEESDESEYSVADIKLEGSKENFTRCLTKLLGYGYKKLMVALDDQEAVYRVGPRFDEAVRRMGEFLAKKPMFLGHGISAQVGDRIALDNEGANRNVRVAPTVEYVFDRTGAKSSEYAWPGLSQYGPYDRSSFAGRSPRILVAYPASTAGKVEVFLRFFRDGMGTNYPGFPKGFTDVFGLVKVDFIMCPVGIDIGDRQTAASTYNKAIQEKLTDAGDVQAGIIVLFDEHGRLPDPVNPYIHTKSLLLTLGIPTQEVRLPTVILEPKNLQYTLQNFAVSMYAKLNGTPWTVNHDKTINDELVVGMGVAELSGSRSDRRQRFVGITTVFSGDGTYLLGNVSKECAYEGYPDAIRESMLQILRELKKRNNWQPGDTVRVVFHAHRPLKRVDVAGIVFECTREIGSEQDIQMAFVAISHEHPFMILDRKQQGIPAYKGGDVMKGVFAPARGTIARIGRFTRLLAVNAPRLIKRPNTRLPAPLLISLHQDSTFRDVDYLAEQALKFTSLSWRSTLPAGTPVTIFYSERIAELLGRLRNVPDWSPAALNVKLKWSRWFL
ncbi:argonaute/piwi family protein [Devosia sp.]|uniref:argonaute/piwi family protein n=1 Tax=Devosia sp. TaxID=1871048 RepID=UPI003F704909